MHKMNKQTLIFSAILLAVLSIGFISADITGDETMTRTASVSTTTPGSTFTLTYTAIGAVAPWGASIQDSVTNCKFPSGANSYRTVMLSEDGNTKSITITAPSTAGTCTFTGDYQYGTSAIKTFSAITVNVEGGSDCTPTCGTKVCGSNGCGGVCGTCDTEQTCTSGQCVTSGGTNNTLNFCWQQGSDFISKYTNSDNCQNNTFILIGIIIGCLVLIAFILKK